MRLLSTHGLWDISLSWQCHRQVFIDFLEIFGWDLLVDPSFLDLIETTWAWSAEPSHFSDATSDLLRSHRLLFTQFLLHRLNLNGWVHGKCIHSNCTKLLSRVVVTLRNSFTSSGWIFTCSNWWFTRRSHIFVHIWINCSIGHCFGFHTRTRTFSCQESTLSDRWPRHWLCSFQQMFTLLLSLFRVSCFHKVVLWKITGTHLWVYLRSR